jgi:hypothetical protein
MSLTNEERAKYRKISDHFLKHPEIVRDIERRGWDAPIAWGHGQSPTYADVRDTLCLPWIPWMMDFLRED